MKILALICSIFLLSACCHNPQVIDRAVVQPWPEPPVIARPIIQLSENDADKEKIRNLNITIIELMDYSRQLENSLNGYRHTPK